MTTRLDRLLLILDTGSSPATRKTAAKQVGEVQKYHPHELPNLLRRVHTYLRSKNWDTRVAAAQAIEAICQNVSQWEPDGVKEDNPERIKSILNDEKTGKLCFEDFDITVVLEKGEKLLGSAGDEFDMEEEIILEGMTQEDILKQQRQMLHKRLGLDGPVSGLDFGMADLIDNNDFLTSPKPKKVASRQSSAETISNVMASQFAAISSDNDLSTREKNKAKRKVKSLMKQRSNENRSSLDGSDGVAPEKRQRRTQSVLVEQPSEDKILMDKVADETMSMDELDTWPFENFTIALCNDLFNASWEVRHGAASALREIIKIHGKGAGRRADTPLLHMVDVNQIWLSDVALKLLCVFALDRFGDFVSDEVVAPVRETCAQTLGSTLHHMTQQGVHNVLKILIQLQNNEHWQVKHGGLLGLKYMLAVRKDMGKELLPLILPWILTGLRDGDDDVRAVAADALLPVSNLLVSTMPETIANVISILWDILLDLDDLTASTNSVMNLLSSIISASKVQDNNNLHELVPRLFPFFDHSIMSVRSSVLETLQILLQIPQDMSWLSNIAEKQLSYIYQRVALEQCTHIKALAVQVWKLTVEKLDKMTLQCCVQKSSPTWFRLLVQPSNSPIDPSLLIGQSNEYLTMKKSNSSDSLCGKIHLANVDSTVEDCIKDRVMINTRISMASCIGLILKVFSHDAAYVQTFTYLLAGVDTLLSSQLAIQQLSGAFLIQEWVKLANALPTGLESIVAKLQSILSSQIVYSELLPLYQRLQIDTQSLIMYFKEKNIELSPPSASYSIDMASVIATQKYKEHISKLSKKDASTAESKQRNLVATINNFQTSYQKHHTRVQASVAGALVAINKLTEKLNPIIRPIMESIKREEDEQMQKRISTALAQLLILCVQRKPCPNSKIIKNLCSFVCSDVSKTPQLHLQNQKTASDLKSSFDNDICKCDVSMGVLTLQIKQTEALKVSLTKRGRLSRNNSSQNNLDVASSILNSDKTNETELAAQIQRRGAESALSTCVSVMEDKLVHILPSLWETLHTNIKNNVINPQEVSTDGSHDDVLNQLISSMQILEVTAQSLHSSLKTKLPDLLGNLCRCLHYPYTSIRHMAARCFGTLSKVITDEAMHLVLTDISGILNQRENIIGRQGAVEALVCVIENLGLEVLPYIVLLIVPILSCMSDQIDVIRLTATNCFATLVQLMPLESGIPNPISMSAELVERKTKERHFLEQLLDNSKIDKFTISVPIQCELRKYQQDGVNWLAFLRKYNLHGILCDDMGLGKTLQSICIMAADYHNQLRKYKLSGKEDLKPHPSLVVCPPTLTGHWCYEVEKFCEKQHLSPLHYTGSPGERQRLQSLFHNHNLVVASYDIIRNDSDFFLSKYWNYCILDEGHIIKNSKTKLSRVIKQIRANHRLILSGTPIQNNVLELWSLFDFLMPGFLGSEKEFTAKFGKPILQSRDAKSSKDQEAGALAMEALHKQTLPFLLRRVKEDVLQDLPPKIIQDYYCDLSPLQIKLYEDFSRSQARKNINDSVTDQKQSDVKETGHIFQALQYLRKVCNHPSLVLKPSHPEYSNIMQNIQESKISLNSIQHSGKLLALKQLLLDCGIGVTDGTSSSESSLDAIVSQHRALIFCQLKSMLDMVENTLLKGEMRSVTYARLDGSVPASQRHDIVQRFNNDPSIDVLLLTTHVGGLGLNLTGADTVIFVEHDWNPMKDLQAMDRAHRIGQKKVVNVYRLIARGTLEEKIMGLQKFKINIANTVITQDNSSLQAMDTSQLLDLFTVGSSKDEKKPSNDSNRPQSMKNILENMGELWSEDQYSNEYDLDQFMTSLKH